jgi:hypothetical protein
VPERVDCDRHLLVDLRADERRLRLRRLHGVAERLHLVGEEARCFAEAAGVVDASTCDSSPMTAFAGVGASSRLPLPRELKDRRSRGLLERCLRGRR